ncbi:MAG: leucine-rich repeat protein [Tannerella sp.]|jgi:hypothetical protein|nr:leucine-rich repeat protein [Tannerella sp.]
MASLSFRTVPPLHFLVDNPVMFELFSDTQEYPIEFDIEVDGDPVYAGIFVPVGTDAQDTGDMAVQDILKPCFAEPSALVSPDAIVSEVERMYIDFTITFRQDDATLTHAARAYRGGISKEMLRFLREEGSDIFAWRLMNTQRQFFMTTRTSSSRLVLRDDELAPLCFIATGKTHRVTADTGETYIFPATEPGKVYAFNIEAFVRSLSERPKQLSIPLFMGYVMTIDLVEAARVPERFVLEFTNSYGVSERLEVTGRSEYEPEVGDESYNVYDFSVDDYIERNDRQKLREVIHAESGYKTLDELLFMRDLLQSDRHYLIDSSGVRREVRVTADEFTHAVHPVEPQNVTLSIRLVDDDTLHSPAVPEDSHILDKLFMATLNVASNRLLNSLPFTGNVSLTVDWGDGTEETVTGDYPQHTYSAAGEYSVVVMGHADNMSTNLSAYNASVSQVNWGNNLTAVDRWGDLGWVSMENACYGCVNLSQVERRVKFDQVTTVGFMFQGCSSLEYTLTQMQAPLLTTATSMYSQCSSLEEVSEYLFAGCPNLEYINTLFFTCASLVNIPVNLFANNTKLKEAIRVFANCPKLHNAPSFYNNRQISTFEYLFSSCTSLKVVPDYCFYQSTATSMNAVFWGCTSLTAIPDHVFSGATEVLNYDRVFSQTGLASISKDIFRDSTKVTSFRYAFSHCLLTSIPEDLFRYNTEVLYFDNLFDSSPLALSIPANLFRYNINAISFKSLFAVCTALQSVPGSLFQYNTNAYDFTWLFRASGLTDVPASLFANIKNDADTNLYGCFDSTKITTVPETLFNSLTQITSMSNVFVQSSLSSIPEDLFRYNVNITSFVSMFAYCSSLTSIPAGLFSTLSKLEVFRTNFLYSSLATVPEILFANCPALRDIENAFAQSPLIAIPNLLFDNNKGITSFYQCFFRCLSLTGSTPSGSDGVKLWERAGQPGYPASINGGVCFYLCSGLDDFDAIPAGWK